MYDIIDAHAHIYPQKIALKATRAIGAFYDIPMCCDGTADTLLTLGDRAGISRFFVHSVATSPSQVAHINDFIAAEAAAHRDRLIGFATLHPDMDAPDKELARARAMGLVGVKLHPDFQKFQISDPRMDRAYAAMSEMRMPVLFHTGDSRYDWSGPRHIPILRKKFPRLAMICAHFGGYTQWKEAAEILPGEDVYVDTSSSFFALSDEDIISFIHAYGVNRVLFGSDYPMWNPENEVANLLRIGLTEADAQAIFAGNALALIGA